ncbi:Methylated-DNA--protein-cysteine methyltransferase [Myotis davidii]|uniref:Methylated-DNA--protein-cysteine methyltransferase n=1 Tax=Myotis davidii TaxID=225400 RepID=L5MGE1_MYODS|nr:Methylated-DNA--protein-cysteine methyltransferase [Myotis davidii]
MPVSWKASQRRRPFSVALKVRGRMDAACEVKHRVVASPVGQLRISGCEQGLHGISLLGGTPAAAG